MARSGSIESHVSRTTANLCHKTDLQHLSGQAQRQSQGGAQSDLYFQTSPDSKGGASVASSISEFRNHDCVRVLVFSGGRGCTQREPLQAEKEMLRIQLQEEFVPVPGTAPKKSEPPSPPPASIVAVPGSIYQRSIVPGPGLRGGAPWA